MSKRSRAAVARSAAGDRVLVLVVGLLLVLASVAALLVGYGVFGFYRAQRPLIDPIALAYGASHSTPARWIAIAAGIVLLIVGVLWALHSLRPEPRPDLLLAATPGERTVVEHSAVAKAVKADAEGIEGVSRARVRLVGTVRRPALRLTLGLIEDADVRDVWAELDGRVLARARQAFGVDAMPTAVRLELDAAKSTAPRVL